MRPFDIGFCRKKTFTHVAIFELFDANLYGYRSVTKVILNNFQITYNREYSR